MNDRVRSYLERASSLLASNKTRDAAGFEKQASDEVDKLGCPPVEMIALLEVRSRRQLAQADWDGAQTTLEQLLPLADQTGDARARYEARHRLGLAYQGESNDAKAIELFDDALDVAHDGFGPNYRPAIATRLSKAASLRRLDRDPEATWELKLALDTARETGDTQAASSLERFLAEQGTVPVPKGTVPLGTDAKGTVPKQAPPALEGVPKPDDAKLAATLAELDALIGLTDVKARVHSLVNFLRVQQLRGAAGFEPVRVSHHLVFTGSPGTGKTTVARLFGRLLQALGVLATDNLIESSRGQIVAGYVGQTAARVNQIVDKALGGVLFIDEAYALTDTTSGEDFGREAVAELIKRMEDDRARLAMIFAGYSKPMQRFLESNPGLESRVSEVIEFADYAPAELVAIFESFAKDGDYTLTDATRAHLQEVMAEIHKTRDERFGNARTVRNLFEDAITAQADRLMGGEKPSGPVLTAIEPADLDVALKGYLEEDAK